MGKKHRLQLLHDPSDKDLSDERFTKVCELVARCEKLSDDELDRVISVIALITDPAKN